MDACSIAREGQCCGQSGDRRGLGARTAPNQKTSERLMECATSWKTCRPGQPRFFCWWEVKSARTPALPRPKSSEAGRRALKASVCSSDDTTVETCLFQVGERFGRLMHYCRDQQFTAAAINFGVLDSHLATPRISWGRPSGMAGFELEVLVD